MVQLYQAEAVVFDQALSPAQQRNLERHLGVAVADRTMLILEIFGERAQQPRRQAPGRAGAAAVPVDAAGAALEPPRAPARRHRHPRRPGRGADRARPADDRRAHQGDQEAARAGQAPAQHAAPRARAQRRPSASRWSATPTPASRRSSTPWSTPRPTPPTSCSRRSTRRRASCISTSIERARRPLRHGRLHPRPAAHADRGVPGDAAGSRRCRPAAARRRRAPAPSSPSRCARSSACSTRSAPARCAQVVVFNKIDRLDETERPRVLADSVELPSGRRVPRVFVSARQRRRTGRAARVHRRPGGARARGGRLESRRRGLI